MFLIYRFFINIIFLFSPLIIVFRLLKKKESLKRFKEKFCFFSKKKIKGKLIWFHGASVGEINSIIPLLEKLNNDKRISQILITTNTLSAEKIVSGIKLKKITHQFFPIDINYLVEKFINYWKPSVAFFIDSEIWPNMLDNLNKKKIPIILLNARISKKSFKRWNKLKYFSKEIFRKINLCIVSNKESKNYLKLLGAKNIKNIGNLKFTQTKNYDFKLNENLINFYKNKKIWCASSTHNKEEEIIAKAHIKLKSKHPKLLTIIIPRHINRINEIKHKIEDLGLKVDVGKSPKKIHHKIDIFLVNSYGKTKSFFLICKNVFLGGSLIDHGGQNPIEAVTMGCKTLHGPNVYNFREIYTFLKENKFSYKVKNEKEIFNYFNKEWSKKNRAINMKNELNQISKKILLNTLREIDLYINCNAI